jgi:hypothetical protein
MIKPPDTPNNPPGSSAPPATLIVPCDGSADIPKFSGVTSTPTPRETPTPPIVVTSCVIPIPPDVTEGSDFLPIFTPLFLPRSLPFDELLVIEGLKLDLRETLDITCF